MDFAAAETDPCSAMRCWMNLSFQEKRAAFVTLTKKQALRGCIGSLVAVEDLAASVRRNAVNAALHDPHFPPLSLREPEEVHILSFPYWTRRRHCLVATDSKDLLQQLEPTCVSGQPRMLSDHNNIEFQSGGEGQSNNENLPIFSCCLTIFSLLPDCGTKHLHMKNNCTMRIVW